MPLKWLDSLEIALALMEKHPKQDPVLLHFTELREWVLALHDFDDDVNHCNEQVLEAIQQCWIAEM